MYKNEKIYSQAHQHLPQLSPSFQNAVGEKNVAFFGAPNPVSGITPKVFIVIPDSRGGPKIGKRF
jgi:hypothetical protein